MVVEKIESTLALVKPDAFDNTENIITIIKRNGFVISERQVVTLSKERAAQFYEEHKERSFYDDLTTFMSSGPTLALVLRKADAITSWRQLMGPTNSDKARKEAPDSIRAKFGTDGSKNATHGSDSPQSAAREIAFFFPEYQHSSEFNGQDVREYLTKTVTPLLTTALTEMCRLNPSDPVEWLGHYLLKSAGISAEPAKPSKNIYFVLGGPGSGKGTQCAKLVEKLSFDHFSAGDLLRNEVSSGSEQGKMIGEMIKEGKIVPGHITLDLLRNAIDGSNAPGVLIDGFPRQLGQAGSFEKEVSDFEFVLFFDCPEEEMERRLLQRGKTSGRSDDNIDSIRKRFNTFVNTSMPVIEYYEAKGKVHKIDATMPIDTVTEAILKLF
ncbi:UMP-CMP kinase 3 [Gracilariopsis chorda]|uniref:adenylate kinase n=1 Tax=Gracilariopsis chorda TaxID=448386 RepID=A0A2V3ISV7_9FLOR|nr:UMP-CMP kinase 3 [Gracilariopsis chorda]|eukprot:PXF44190.1 UMP-CMP kinase 3 [Gracilariopsis chorda]